MYEQITSKEFSRLYYFHQQWLRGEENGKRLKLLNKEFLDFNLSGLDLSYAILTNNHFQNMELEKTTLIGTSLDSSRFIGCDFSEANFTYSTAKDCFFKGCLFNNSILSNSNFSNSSFLDGIFKSNITNKSSEIYRKTQSYPITCPEKGSFIGFKSAGKKIVELLILEDAKRTSSFSRKCRCDKAKVNAIYEKDGTLADCNFVESDYDNSFIYKVGEIVEVNDFDDNRWNECSKGIHFYLTFQEAVRN